MNNSCKKTSIGGQAVIEGIMMRGPEKTSIVVRKSNGELERKITPNHKNKKPSVFTKIPFVRGIFNLGTSLVAGYDAINFSASFFEDDDDYEPKGFEKWLMEKCGDKFNDYLMTFSMILGVGLAILLFFMLPTIITGFLSTFIVGDMARALTEGAVRIAIFIAYIYLVSFMPDIKRVYKYHGAEHKTISCYEAGEELTVENIRKFNTLHPRCGTSFLLIVMVVSILVFSFLSWDNMFVRLAMRIVLIPVVVGISYEIIKLAGRYDNILTRIISYPGMMLQKITTSEPDDSMLEVAIAAMKDVIPTVEGSDQW